MLKYIVKSAISQWMGNMVKINYKAIKSPPLKSTSKDIHPEISQFYHDESKGKSSKKKPIHSFIYPFTHICIKCKREYGSDYEEPTLC